MELDEDQEVIPDAETMEFYRIGPPVPSILRKPGERSKRLEISRRVSFSKDVSEGSSESLNRRLRFNAPPPGRTLRKKQSISVIAFCSFAMVTLVGVFWGYIIHGIVHTEDPPTEPPRACPSRVKDSRASRFPLEPIGVTPVPTYRNREYLKASPQEEVLRDLDDSDYAVPNLVFLTERSRRRRLRTPVVVLRRHPPPIVSETPSLPTRRWNRTRTYRPRRRSANATTTHRRRGRPTRKPTRKPVFQWRSKVLVSPASTSETDSIGRPPSVVEDESASPSQLPPEATSRERNNGGDENALFPGDDVEVGVSDGSRETDSRSRRGGLLGTRVTLGDASDNGTSLVGNDTEVTYFAGHAVDSSDTRQDNSSGIGAPQDSSHESSADDYEDDRSDPGGAEEEVVSSNALLSGDEERAANDTLDHVGRNESLHPALVDEATRNGAFEMNATTTLNVNVTTKASEAVALGGVVNVTGTDYYD